MCGITGFFLPRSASNHPAEKLEAGGLLRHRGPDDYGTWRRPDARVGLQHYRLSIVDLSPTGAQPMKSPSGRYVISFNGEIYNHRAIRQQLEAEGHRAPWRGTSDTETILHAIEHWGARATLERCVGMFAMAIHDNEEGGLLLARDRLGEKPLYLGWFRGAFVFASEPKALVALDPGEWSVSNRALAAYLRLGYVPGSQSIYEGLHRLAPGTLVAIREADVADRRIPPAQPFWALRPFQPPQDAESAVEGFEARLGSAIEDQMVADVPLGVLLSGGIDSSLVAALMQARSASRVRTFTIGFQDSPVDEAPYARRIAQHLGTEHTELYVSPRDAIDAVPSLAEVYCEPFADSSQVPTLLLSRLARQHVTVALTGDGGDELFAGYDRYERVVQGWARIARWPLPARVMSSQVLEALPDGWLRRLAAATPGGQALQNPADRVRKIGAVLSSASAAALNRSLMTLWEPGELMSKPAESESAYSGELPHGRDLYSRLMLADLGTYLPDDLLVKVDRAAMAASLETRAPFLDHRVVEYALALPTEMKVRNGQSKWLPRQVLARHVPAALFERPKQGFGLPLADWLRGPLRDWADSLLSAASLERARHLDIARVRTRWLEHLSGRRNWQHSLWCILMLQAWLLRSDPRTSPSPLRFAA